ncbi:MAG: phage tail protein, partial [Candidatus Nanohaloarchaea archaeon]
MNKFIVLTTVFLLFTGLSAAVDQHNTKKTSSFEVQIDDVQGWQDVTIPGKSVEQDSYREGNEAKHEKKMWGQVTFDDLEMERGVKPGATELHDWIKDIQAGKADSGRKEIAVVACCLEDDKDGDGYGDVIRELAWETDQSDAGEHEARKGRNPQTGKEIKIPAKKEVKVNPGAIINGNVKKMEHDDRRAS